MEASMEHFAGHSKLGPREKGRKCKGKKKPQALRNARKRRSSYLQSLGKTNENSPARV